MSRLFALLALAWMLALPSTSATASGMIEGVRRSTSVDYGDGVSARIDCDVGNECVANVAFRGTSYTFDKKSLGGEIEILPRFLALSYSLDPQGTGAQDFSAWFEFGCDLEVETATETACIALVHVEDGKLKGMVKLKRSVMDDYISSLTFED